MHMTMENDLDDFDLSMENDEQMQEIIDLLHEIPEIPIPAEFDLRFKQALQIEKKKKKVSYWKRWSAVAAVFAVGFVSIFFLNDGNSVMPTNLQIKGQSQEEEQAFDKYGSLEPTSAADQGAKLDEKKQEIGTQENNLEKNQSEIKQNQVKEKAVENKLLQDQSAIIYRQPKMLSVTPSRSFAYSGTVEEFNRCGEQKMIELVQEINEKKSFDRSNDIVCFDITTEEALSTEIAPIVMKLYQDIFENQEVTYKKILKDSIAGACQVYEIQGNGKSIPITITNSLEGIRVSEAILDHGAWLEEQMTNTTFVLNNYELGEEDSIIFHVNVLMNENGEKVNEMRSIVWKPTKS